VKPVRIVATWDEDENQTFVLIAIQDDRGWLSDNVEIFGYVKDWDENCRYARYPFVVECLSDTEAILDWGGFDSTTTTTADIYGRRLVQGEKVVRVEDGESSVYTIKSIVPFVGE
jgi:hypothetical protein